MDISPRDDSPGIYPIYQRNHLKNAGPNSYEDHPAIFGSAVGSLVTAMDGDPGLQTEWV